MQPDQTTVTLSRPGSKPHEQIDIVIPATLGSVRLLTQIGQGGMGIVYRGRDQLLNRDVAVKFLTNAIATPDDPNFSAFLEGARSAAALQHASLTTVHQAGVVESVPYIVMQLVDGPTVSQLIKTTDPLNGPEALAILIDVAAAIAELHDRNIIHRDIKPSNVLLDPDGHVIVSDFGLAHRHRRGTATNSSSGTPAYMAPEMFSGEVTLRSDVYALGIMGFELLAGKLPFRGDVTQTQEQHKSAPLPLAELKDVPPEIIDILERAAHKNAMFRHKSARQFLRALQSATDSSKIGQGRYSIFQRVTRTRTGAPDAIGATAPRSGLPETTPEPSTYFDHLSKIAAGKRSHRSSLETPPPQTTTRHCLHCGYNRHDLIESRPCPQCGHVDDLDHHQRQCLQFAANPAKIFWRLLTLRPPPLGWWEVFDEPHLHRFTPRRTAWLILLAALLSAAVMAAGNLIANDLQIRSLKFSESSFYPAAVILFVVGSWLVYRHVWLGAILAINSNLSANDRQAAARAMSPLSLIFLSLPVGMIVLLSIMIVLRLLVPFPAWTFNIIAAFMLIWPPILLMRAIRADVSGRFFPNRSLARLFLAAAALLNSIILAICIGTASLVIRVLNAG